MRSTFVLGCAAALLTMACGDDEPAAGGDGGAPDAAMEGGSAGGSKGSGGSGGSNGSGGSSGAGTGGSASSSGGTASADAAADASDAGDGGAAYCPLSDFSPASCAGDGQCQAGHECFRGVCLRTCGMPLADLDANLGDAVEPVATVCNSRAPLYVTRQRTDGDCTRVDVFGYRVSGSGNPGEANWVLRTYEVDPFLENQAVANPGTGTFDAPGGSPSFQSALRLNPAGTRLGSFLYYNAADPNPMVVDLTNPDVQLGAALEQPSSYYGVDWIDDDRLIVAQNATGSAVFVVLNPASASVDPVPVLTGFGDYAGSVRVLHEAGLVLAGDAGTKLYVIELSRVLAVADGTVAAPIDVTTDSAVQELTGPLYGSFDVVGETHLLIGENSFGEPQDAHRITVTGTTIGLGAAQRLLENVQAFEGAVPLSGDLVYLPHFQRALIARWKTP